MSPSQREVVRKNVSTPSGVVSYLQQGEGPVALFVHGVLLNSHLWRHQMAELADVRCCIAVDLLAHGETAISPEQEVSVTANARMLAELLDALEIPQVDLVGNDSGGGIAQIFAATNPERIRSLTLTNCDTQDNWPPQAFTGFLEMSAQGGLRDALEKMLREKDFYRSAAALGPAYEHPERLLDETIDIYLTPFLRSPQRLADLERFLAAFDCRHTVAIEPRLRELVAPTLVVWGTDDVYFDTRWSRWLEATIPGCQRRVELEGARLFFPEERPELLNRELRALWKTDVRDAA